MLTTQFKDITYKSERDLWTLETDIFYILEWKWDLVGFNYEKDIVKLQEQLVLYKLWLSNYLLESDNKDFLGLSKENLVWNWVEILWNFERQWKFYLILYKPDIDWGIDAKFFDDISQKVTTIISPQ